MYIEFSNCKFIRYRLPKNIIVSMTPAISNFYFISFSCDEVFSLVLPYVHQDIPLKLSLF